MLLCFRCEAAFYDQYERKREYQFLTFKPLVSHSPVTPLKFQKFPPKFAKRLILNKLIYQKIKFLSLNSGSLIISDQISTTSNE